MRYSKLFGKTTKTVSNDIKMTSHKLLVQAGFIRESTAGRYFMLPLGIRVQQKIMAIIKEEMDKAGAQEMITPVLHPLELWEETNRNNAAGFELMQVKDRRGAKFALGGTAEEMFVDVVRKFPLSYKDLPFNIYQFSSKFRDELRARGGLLRVREFVMKDAYSFDRDEEEFKKEYQKMWDSYKRIFTRLGYETKVVESDNGYIGGEYCHEFVVENENGETKFLETEDGSYCTHEEVAKFNLDNINLDEEEKPFTIIDQPEWVHTMEDVYKHFGREAKYCLKNVVYKNFQGDIVIATIRGDLEVNPIKLQHVLHEVVPLELANEEDLAAIGSKTGYVHSWGNTMQVERKAKTQDRNCRVIYVADLSLYTVHNFIGGQKEETTDSINVNYGRDFKHEIEGDIALAKEGYTAPNGQKLVAKRGIEVGNIFQLGYHYSHLMEGATFTDQDGTAKPYYMGCYGIGIGRNLQTIVEMHHDGQGIIWPEAVAPFKVHLISLEARNPKSHTYQQAGEIRNNESQNIKEEIKNKSNENSLSPKGEANEIGRGIFRAEEVYQNLITAGIEVLYDDRTDVSAGQKFADADLIGCPIRLVISPRNGEKVEWKRRDGKESELVEIEEMLKRLK